MIPQRVVHAGAEPREISSQQTRPVREHMSGSDIDTGDMNVGGMNVGGIGYCIRPGAPVPPTLLVAEMGDGALLLQGWRAGPSAYVCPADTGPLRVALEVAFGSHPVTASHSRAPVACPGRRYWNG